MMLTSLYPKLASGTNCMANCYPMFYFLVSKESIKKFVCMYSKHQPFIYLTGSIPYHLFKIGKTVNIFSL